jgi:hypothetical protein
VTTLGTGKDSHIVHIENACGAGEDAYCFGRTDFENINFQKINLGKKIFPNPVHAVFLENEGICQQEGCRIDRAIINYSAGTIDGLPAPFYLKGKVDLTINEAIIKNISRDDADGAVIIALSGGDLIIDPGNGAPAGCNFEMSPNIVINGSDICFNNTGYYLFRTEHSRLGFSNTTIHDCTTAWGVYTECSDVTTDNLEAYNLDVSDLFSIDGNSTLNIASSVFHHITSSWTAAVILNNGQTSISNSLMYSNTSVESNGGALYYNNGTVSSTDTCWSSNTPADVSHQNGSSYNFGCDDFICDASGCWGS